MKAQDIEKAEKLAEAIRNFRECYQCISSLVGIVILHNRGEK